MATVAAGMVASIAKSLLFERMRDEAKKEGSPLNGTINKVMSQILEGMAPDDVIEMINSSESGPDLEERLNKYRRTGGQWAKEMVTKAIGTVAGAAGDFWDATNSILANALMAQADSMVSPEFARRFGNPFKGPAAAYSGGKMAQGKAAGIAGNALGSYFNDWSRRIQGEFDAMRNTRALLEANAPGYYFLAQNKHAAASGNNRRGNG